ncbi:NAD(P)/FAD-dependent oxidoreductase [Chitinimonas prasina]|uniref:NAD(P)/FAD-dependent oxidoreductase n=1 Tax=Chitinimonas prasina TaxID=1434937 RepID=UPI0024E1372C|nr:FAD-binding oxidoreductase [Chitinimonas prasina]
MTPPSPSWYASRQPAPAVRPCCSGRLVADVGILGGGLTGLSSALYLAEQGVSVALLEADRIGSGASGRNGGQALQGFAGSMTVVEQAVGPAIARQLWDMSLEALALLKQHIARFNIACDLSPGGYVYAALHEGQLAELAQWQQQARQRYGYVDLQLLDCNALQAHVGSSRYVGGLYDPNETHLDPWAYTLGLADAAEAAGAKLYEHSPASGWQRDGDGYCIATPAGQLHCRQLFLATNATALTPQLARHFLPVESFIVATEPLDAGLVRSILPSNAAVADCNRVLNYFRLSPDHRLLFGGRAAGTATDRLADTQARMLQVFPQLADARIEHAWGGRVDVTPHKLPHLGRLPDGALFAQGFSGHGLALSGLVGKVMAEAMLGRPERLALFERIPQHALPTHLPGFTQAALTLGMAWYQWRDWLDARWHGD